MHLLEHPTAVVTRWRARFKDPERERRSGGMADYMVTHADPDCPHINRETTEPVEATVEEVATHGRCAVCG
jgi:hypothetical protein